ncbi:MAG: UDP-glucose 4-epimerase GalE [Actinomycetota bacterium]|nr:UDP-glucose 4-epimerase GalE [Actinomycetota bacterium]
MRIIVTGGAGYIGSVTARMLAKSGNEILILDDLSKGHREAVKGLDLAVAQIGDKNKVKQVCGEFAPQACIHFAAKSLVAESVENPLAYFQANLGGSMNILEALLGVECKVFIFSSTAAVYGEPKDVPLTEDSETRPLNPYGSSKLMFEQVLEQTARATEMKFVSLRYFNAAGADLENDLGEDHHPETHLIPRVIAVALGKEPCANIYGTDYPTPDGTCVRDYIHVTDLAAAHALALERLARGGESGIYNLGNENGRSVREVVEEVKKVSGRDFPVKEAPRRPGDPAVLVASSKRAKAELGWEPKHESLEDIVRSAWEWHKRHPDGYLT